MNARRMYLAGPMSGYGSWNFPAFELAAKNLRARGIDVLSAHEIDHGAGQGDLPHWQYLRTDIRDGLIRCDAIALLPGWPSSKGALIEFNAAAGMGYEIYFYDPDADQLVQMSGGPA